VQKEAIVRTYRLTVVSAAIFITVLLAGAAIASAQTAPTLGAAQSFAVLGSSTVTNTGSTIVTGDLGLSPGTAVTGFPPGVVVSGSIYAANALSQSAQNALTTAYNSVVSQGCTADLTGQNLGGLTLTPGVYCFTGSAQLTGALTLNAQGNANAVFLFKIGTTLTTASGSSVLMINAGSACNVYWQVGSSATLGTASSLAGTIMAQASITLTTGASLTGRALARSGAVTLDTNSVTVTCPSAAVCPTIVMSPPTLLPGTVGTPYSSTITASGGASPYTFSVTSGTLPPGMTLTAAGVLSGTPTTAGTSTPTIRATDANGCFASIVYSIVVTAPVVCPVITLVPPTLPTGIVFTPYILTLAASGGAAPYIFTISSGALPPGMALAATGAVSGTPTTAGTSSVTIRGTDANGCFASAASIVVIAPAVCPTISLTPSPLPNGRVGTPYVLTLIGSGGTGPYIFGVTTGALPAGMILSTAGAISGTPTTATTSSVTIRGTDANGCFASTVYTVLIVSPTAVCPVITLTPSTLPNATLGVAYSQTVAGSGGLAPYVFSVTTGVLPPGLLLSPTGVLSGTPTSSGSSGFTIRGTDANGCFSEIALGIIVTTPVPTLPAVFMALLALMLVGAGYTQLSRRVRPEAGV